MGTTIVGKVIVSAKIENLFDIEEVFKGRITDDQVRRLEVDDAMVDTGATTLSLPKNRRAIVRVSTMPSGRLNAPSRLPATTFIGSTLKKSGSAQKASLEPSISPWRSTAAAGASRVAICTSGKSNFMAAAIFAAVTATRSGACPGIWAVSMTRYIRS